jgi:hypothetical protein
MLDPPVTAETDQSAEITFVFSYTSSGAGIELRIFEGDLQII